MFLREIHKADAEAPIRLNVGDHAAHPEQFVMGELQLKAEPSGRGFAIVRFDEAAAQAEVDRSYDPVHRSPIP